MIELQKVRLGDICKFQNGYAFKSKDFIRDGQYNVVKIKELKNGKVKFFEDTATIDLNIDDYENYSIFKGDVLFALTGDPVNKNNPLSWVGRVAIYKEDNVSLLNQRVCKVITEEDKILKEYVYYYFRVFENFYSLAAKATGSASQANISTKTIADTEMMIPSVETQKKIVKLLSALDDKIDNNNQINDNLLEQVMTLFKHIFVELKTEHKICKADEYFSIAIGKTPPRKEQEWFSTDSQNMRWVSISDMGSCGVFISDSSEYLTHEAVNKFNVVVIPDNTVLLSFKLTVGRIAITDGVMTTNEAIAHFKSSSMEINPYLYCYLKNFNFQSLGSTSSIATAVNSKIIKGMPFIIPKDDELRQFNEVALPVFSMIKANQAEIKKLTQLRDTLLPKLMSGELAASALVL